MSRPRVADLTAALDAVYAELCLAEALNVDGASRVALARHMGRAIELCKYLKQPEWGERIAEARATNRLRTGIGGQ